MAEVIVSDLMSRILGYLSQAAIDEAASCWGVGRSEIQELKTTMVMIQARLLDAERVQEGEYGALTKAWLMRVKDVLYQLEDLFEEFAIADQQKVQMNGNKLTKKVRLLFSKSLSPLKFNRRVNQNIKAIRKTMIGITSDMECLNLRAYPNSGENAMRVMNDRETQSFVLVEEVVGRDDDKNAIKRVLLNDEESVSVISIVGIGGLGKTTLAQLAFNDPDVQRHFELKSWACISDISSMKELSGKVLNSVTGDYYHQLSLEQIQARLRASVNDKKYLLVLDDVWDEDRDRWLQLRQFLVGGKSGSKIIVTCRSQVVAQNVSTVEPYELSGLSEEKSWDLFKTLAFKEGQEERHPSLTTIGKEIVRKCANVPLAIRTIAGLLYSKDTEQEWRSFKDCELRKIEQDESSIISALKLSYDHLPPRLKNCFAYCSLFPKDCEFDKLYLIQLWMALGYIEPLDENQSLWDIGEGYFMDLLRRCFFQDVIKDDYEDITHCKMHDLVHDLALFVAGDECISINRPIKEVSDNVRHMRLNVRSLGAPNLLLSTKQMRSLLLRQSYVSYGDLFSGLRCLRALDLHDLGIDSIPDSIGELKYLRYLRLSNNLMNFLPESITTLKKLQTLILQNCYRLTELPRDFCKLVSLRNLDISDCLGLNDMPSGFEKLTGLQRLSDFKVGENNGLDALADFNLEGNLKIWFKKRRENVVSEASMTNLKAKKITHLQLRWLYFGEGYSKEELIYLQPPPTLQSLSIEEYNGPEFLGWGMDKFPPDILFPNLVSVDISFCGNSQPLLPFSQFSSLKFLCLKNFYKMEYIELGGNATNASAGTTHSQIKSFPSLEKLKLCSLRKLKEYWSVSNVGAPNQQQQKHLYSSKLKSVFPRLSYLEIKDCPALTSMNTMSLPSLKKLELEEVHEKLVQELIVTVSISSSSSSAPHSSVPSSATPADNNTILKIQDVGNLITLPQKASLGFSSLEIKECPDLINLPAGSLTSLKNLYIRSCDKLTGISNALQQSSSLEKLVIQDCNNLDIWDKTKNTQACKALKSLHILGICELPSLNSLPEGFRRLTMLRELYICCCENVMALPDWISDLTQLQYLEIKGRSSLIRRCQKPDGEDWPLIQHIPQVVIEEAGTISWFDTLTC